MTTFIPRTNPSGRTGSLRRDHVAVARRRSGRAPAGFTLVEVMIAAALSTFVLAGILSSFLMIGRSGFLSSRYSEMEAEMRRGLDFFGEDARKSADIRWNSSQSITLYLSTASNATVPVTYAYDGDHASATYGCFYRLPGDSLSTAPRQILIRNVASDFSFQRFKLAQPGISDNSAANDLETKLLQLTVRASRAGSTTVAANHSALSARYILRNKRVAN